MRYLLDTNICIYLMQRHPPHLLQQLESQRQGDVAISVVTYAELRAGVEIQAATRQQNEQALSLLIKRIPVLPFEENAASSYGKLRAAVRERNRNAFDRLIAAHALSLDLILVTNNVSDFADYPGLKIENWAGLS